jgi:hypothetical protein
MVGMNTLSLLNFVQCPPDLITGFAGLSVSTEFFQIPGDYLASSGDPFRGTLNKHLFSQPFKSKLLTPV